MKGRARNEDQEVTDTRNELDLLTMANDAPEQRAQKLLQVNQLELRRYYDQTLGQGRYLFYVGIACILLGFGVVAASLVLVREAADGPTHSQLVIGILGAVGGILANFVGVIYLRMYSETVKSITTFHNRLVGTHDLYFGNLLAAKITSLTERELTLGQMALGVTAATQQERQFARNAEREAS